MLICRALNFIEIYLKIFIKTLDFHIVSLIIVQIIPYTSSKNYYFTKTLKLYNVNFRHSRKSAVACTNQLHFFVKILVIYFFFIPNIFLKTYLYNFFHLYIFVLAFQLQLLLHHYLHPLGLNLQYNHLFLLGQGCVLLQ